MQNKILADVIREIAGEQSNNILEILIDKRDVNEFLIAKKMKLTINQIRNIFYKLSNFGIVSFIRKKDKRKGWYTYFWTLKIEKTLELLEKRLKKEVDELQNQLRNRETKRFYVCKTCNIEVGEENALLHNFTCQECGQVYELNDDMKVLNALRTKIIRLEKERVDVMREISLVKESERKKHVRKDARVKKKAKKDRKAKRDGKIKIKKVEKKTKKKKRV